MTKYELWLKSCDKPNIQLALLEDKNSCKLFKFIEKKDKLKSSNNYEYYFTSYHVWNIETQEWFTSNNYRTSYDVWKGWSNV